MILNSNKFHEIDDKMEVGTLIFTEKVYIFHGR